LDLVIVSHIDHDHIGATRDLFSDQTLGLTFGDVWFNGRHHLKRQRGVAEAEELSDLLDAPGRDLPWNLAFKGGPVVTPGDGKHLTLPAPRGYPRLTLLSPTPKRLERLATVWDAELKKLRARQSNTEVDLERSDVFPDLSTLAAHKSSKDRSAPNGSSIAILLEHQGASLLVAADAFATVLGSAFLGLARQRKLSLPLPVDVFKLSHHGSRGNLFSALLGAVRAEHYVISTNNDRFGHPHDETLARVVLYGGTTPTLWFNYATKQNLRWADPQLQLDYQFKACFPKHGEQGLTLPIPLKRYV
jgi:hypothetical protein